MTMMKIMMSKPFSHLSFRTSMHSSLIFCFSAVVCCKMGVLMCLTIETVEMENG